MRVMLINPLTGAGFDWEAPYKTITRTVALSGFSKITATFPATYNRHQDSQGYPWIMERGTIVVAEETNGNLISAIVIEAPLQDDLEVQAAGLSSLATNIPWDAKPVEWFEKDALVAWREIWEHIIARSGVKNFRVTGDTKCGVTVGRGPSADYRRVQADIARAKPEMEKADRWIRKLTREAEDAALRMYRATGRKQVGAITTGTEDPTGVGSYLDAYIQLRETDTDHTGPETAMAVWFWGTGDFSWTRRLADKVLAAADAWLDRQHRLKAWEDQRKPHADIVSGLESWITDHYEDGIPEPFELNAWSTRDLSAVLEELRELGGFDYVERTDWDGDELVFTLDVRNKVGIPKPDLRFELGVNIHAHPELARGDVRTEVHAHGAGEGKSTLMADRALSHPRLVRTVESVDDADWDTKQLVNKGADKALADARKALEYTIHGLVVHDHPAAPLHAFTVGDSITVRGRHADGVRREFPVRITEITRVGDESKVSLEVDPV